MRRLWTLCLIALFLIVLAFGLFSITKMSVGYQPVQNPPGSTPFEVNHPAFVKFFTRRLTDRFRRPSIPDGHVIPEQQALAEFNRSAGHDTLTWLGHKSFIIRLDGFNLLTDPFLTQNAGPWRLGPRRYVPPGISIDNLPRIDGIIISHDHYDSLDLKTIARIPHKDRTHVVVPLRIAPYFRDAGYQKIEELDWYQSTAMGPLHITAVPAIHFSGRAWFDYNYRLWASYIIQSSKHRLLFMCDSAPGPVFKEIGQHYGPFDLVIIDIAAYEPPEIMQYAHSTPEQSVQMGKELGAKRLVAMHWGTIRLSHEPPFEPPVRFRQAALAAGYRDNQVWVMKIGESSLIPP